MLPDVLQAANLTSQAYRVHLAPLSSSSPAQVRDRVAALEYQARRNQERTLSILSESKNNSSQKVPLRDSLPRVLPSLTSPTKGEPHERRRLLDAIAASVERSERYEQICHNNHKVVTLQASSRATTVNKRTIGAVIEEWQGLVNERRAPHIVLQRSERRKRRHVSEADREQALQDEVDALEARRKSRIRRAIGSTSTKSDYDIELEDRMVFLTGTDDDRRRRAIEIEKRIATQVLKRHLVGDCDDSDTEPTPDNNHQHTTLNDYIDTNDQVSKEAEKIANTMVSVQAKRQSGCEGTMIDKELQQKKAMETIRFLTHRHWRLSRGAKIDVLEHPRLSAVVKCTLVGEQVLEELEVRRGDISNGGFMSQNDMQSLWVRIPEGWVAAEVCVPSVADELRSRLSPAGPISHTFELVKQLTPIAVQPIHDISVAGLLQEAVDRRGEKIHETLQKCPVESLTRHALFSHPSGVAVSHNTEASLEYESRRAAREEELLHRQQLRDLPNGHEHVIRQTWQAMGGYAPEDKSQRGTGEVQFQSSRKQSTQIKFESEMDDLTFDVDALKHVEIPAATM